MEGHLTSTAVDRQAVDAPVCVLDTRKAGHQDVKAHLRWPNDVLLLMTMIYRYNTDMG